MKFELDHGAGARIIRSYGPGEFTVGEQRVRGSMVIMGDQLLLDLLPERSELLTSSHLDALCALGTDLLVIGTGQRQIFPAPALLAAVLARGIGCEVMATPAACRCYNVLVSESRSVAAALFALEPPAG